MGSAQGCHHLEDRSLRDRTFQLTKQGHLCARPVSCQSRYKKHRQRLGIRARSSSSQRRGPQKLQEINRKLLDIGFQGWWGTAGYHQAHAQNPSDTVVTSPWSIWGLASVPTLKTLCPSDYSLFLCLDFQVSLPPQWKDTEGLLQDPSMVGLPRV